MEENHAKGLHQLCLGCRQNKIGRTLEVGARPDHLRSKHSL